MEKDVRKITVLAHKAVKAVSEYQDLIQDMVDKAHDMGWDSEEGVRDMMQEMEYRANEILEKLKA